MNRKQITDALKDNLIRLKDADIKTFTDKTRKDLITSIEAAVNYLENKAPYKNVYPDNLLYDLTLNYETEDEDLVKNTLIKLVEELGDEEKHLIDIKYHSGKDADKKRNLEEVSNVSLKALEEAVKKDLSEKLNDALSESSPDNAGNMNKRMNREDVARSFSGDIDLLFLSPRASNALKRAGFMKIGDINGISMERLRNIKGLGDTSLNEVLSKAEEYGLKIRRN
jgi:DNA-directed RNA polymerase alpha subunit